MQRPRREMWVARDCVYDMDTHVTRRNNNLLCVGTTGCGKTRGIVEPNILTAEGSMVIIDPKGNLYRKYKEELEKKGYDVKHINFVQPEKSNHYNCFLYPTSTRDIVKTAHMIVYGVDAKERGSDPYWNQAAVQLLSSLIGFMKDEGGERCNIGRLMELIRMAPKNGEHDRANGKSILQELMKQRYEKKGAASWVYDQFRSVDVTPPRTYNCVVGTLSALFSAMDTIELREMMKTNDIEFAMIGQKKMAVFVVVSDTDRSMDTLVNLFFSQAMNELCLYADYQCADNRLPVPVCFILDDFATNCKIEDFPRMISSFRSREISVMLMIQSEGQLSDGYKEGARTIVGNCDTYVYMGGADVLTARTVAERCNVPVEEIINMPIDDCWVLRRGEKPVLTKRLDIDDFIEMGYVL